MASIHSYEKLYSTLEPMPDTILYRKKTGRPSLPELIGATIMSSTSMQEMRPTKMVEDLPDPGTVSAPVRKFGTFTVFVRCLLGIWGVILFLRLNYCTGTAGAPNITGIAVFAFIVTFITTLSLATLASNGEVEGGGAYFMLSRNLGPELGGAIGIVFYIANAVGVALHTFGFAETFASLIPGFTGSAIWDQRVICMVAITCQLFIALFGLEYVVKLQNVLLVILILAIGSFVTGVFTVNTPGVGPSMDNLSSIMAARWGAESLQSIFGIYFPAASGLMAGSNISGELKDPQKSIALGTMWAVIAANLTYFFLIWFGAWTIKSDVLIGNSLIMADASIFPPLVLGGIISATLSSAIASLDGAPRVLQALASDRIFSFLNPFAKLSNGEPVRAYILTYSIAIFTVIIGDLNILAPIISNFFLISYGLINYAAFTGYMSKSVSWRPSWKLYNPYLSLFGAILCIGSMFYMNLTMSLFSLLLLLILYIIVHFQNPDVNWGTVVEAKTYIDAILSSLKLQALPSHVKTYRPQYLVLCGNPSERSHLIAFVRTLWKGMGATIVANVVVKPDLKPSEHFATIAARQQLEREILTQYLIEEDIKAFGEAVVADSLRSGVQSLLQSAGIGGMRPNVVVLGLRHFSVEELTIDIPLEYQNEAEMDATDRFNGKMEKPTEKLSVFALAAGAFEKTERRISRHDDYFYLIRDVLSANYAVVVPHLISNIDYDATEGTIDIWWLSDDGGLTLLLPYLLMQDIHFENFKLRLFTMESSDPNETAEQLAILTRMLSGFRIEAKVLVAEDPFGQPTKQTLEKFEAFGIEDSVPSTTKRLLRLHDLIESHSNDAMLRFISLPLPKTNVPPALYLCWLHMLVEDRPTVFVRGNNETVLSFET
eukprot:TRINITY_DN389_c0_g1_i1.p1 TRINITY_DN389_c0_g1~~TRINITY_DN389_c0_g1_i1.p1  ORF type:complete len:885 (+),score=193.14 TRINITY_DN389_c0_g1_i1:57-2711(+)